MRTRWIELTTVALTVLVVVGLVSIGWWFISRNIWSGVAQARDPLGIGSRRWCGGGVMSTTVRYGSNRDGRSNHVCPPGISRVPPESISGTPLTIQQAKEAVEDYVARLGYSNLRVGEVIEFAQSYYAIVKESDTGIGAMELLVDKSSGFVGLEYGPNAMWNARYGMMGGSGSGKMTISSQEALKIAERWLDTYRPGQAPEPEPDAFYGYYTIRTLKDGQISGMLSVQGSSGQVWYHNWHGAFVERIGR